MMPDGPDPESISPERDAAALTILTEELIGDSQPKQPPKTDFVGPWRDIDCNHKSASCQLYGNRIFLECADCATSLEFIHTGKGTFFVSMARLPLPPEEYDWHEADIVLDMIREFAHTLELPSRMADKMSHDPDRDARQIAALVSLFEWHGLLRRIRLQDTGYDSMIMQLSAMLHTRSEFASSAKQIIAKLHSTRATFIQDGRPVSIRQGLESMWLTWPCWFEGVGLDVEVYDPVGNHQYCVRCDFSTLDDYMENDHWRRGCPECVYPGYLLDVGRGTGHARIHQ